MRDGPYLCFLAGDVISIAALLRLRRLVYERIALLCFDTSSNYATTLSKTTKERVREGESGQRENV